MDHEFVSCRRAFFPWLHFHRLVSKKMHFISLLGAMSRCKPNVDQEKWPCTKKWICYFSWYVSKKAVLRIFFVVWPSPLLFPFFPRTYENVWGSLSLSLCMIPWHLQRENLFCLSHCKTCWTMTMINVGLKIDLLGTSSSMVTLTFIYFCSVNWSGTGTSSIANPIF